MSMGRRIPERQEPLFVATDSLRRAGGHPFYASLNELLDQHGFDDFVEAACLPYYKDSARGRPSIAPGVYFRMLFVGYFEDIDSQRGIAWRVGDSISLREFVGLPLDMATPDHSTLSLTRKRLPQEVHEKILEYTLKLALEHDLLSPTAVGVDSTTLEANAAMKSIVRRDTGETHQEYLRRLAAEEGIENPTAEELRRFDRNREGKTCSNEEWESSTDPDAKVAKMKDGTTHFAYKAEHAVDLDSEFIVAAEVYPANAGDASTIVDTLAAAQTHLDAAATLTPAPRNEEEALAAAGAGPSIEEVAADKGYHKVETIGEIDEVGMRTYIPERAAAKTDDAKQAGPAKPEGKKGRKKRWPDERPEDRAAAMRNRERMKRKKGKDHQKRRSEVVERSFAHMCETGGARRMWLRGLQKVRKRYKVQAAARNLGLLMLKLKGIGKPRRVQDGVRGVEGAGSAASGGLRGLWKRLQEYWRQWRSLLTSFAGEARIHAA